MGLVIIVGHFLFYRVRVQMFLLYTGEKRCGVVYQFDICSQGYRAETSSETSSESPPLDTVCVLHMFSYPGRRWRPGLYLPHGLLGILLALCRGIRGDHVQVVGGHTPL
jgi:hypothetical protein